MSLSLQQRIIESSNDLTNLTSTVATLTTDVAEAVAFHKNIIHDDANIKALADRATANAANISTLNSTTLAQQSEIDTITTNVASNAQAITDNNTYFQGKVDEELARAVAAEAGLTAAISAEATRAEAAEVALQAQPRPSMCTRTGRSNHLRRSYTSLTPPGCLDVPKTGLL